MNNSNYPPGVTGNGPQLAGHSQEEEAEIVRRTNEIVLNRLLDADHQTMVELIANDEPVVNFIKFLLREVHIRSLIKDNVAAAGRLVAVHLLSLANDEWHDSAREQVLKDMANGGGAK